MLFITDPLGAPGCGTRPRAGCPDSTHHPEMVWWAFLRGSQGWPVGSHSLDPPLSLCHMLTLIEATVHEKPSVWVGGQDFFLHTLLAPSVESLVFVTGMKGRETWCLGTVRAREAEVTAGQWLLVRLTWQDPSLPWPPPELQGRGTQTPMDISCLYCFCGEVRTCALCCITKGTRLSA